jgi:glycosyltransferase involved in cell wall biosynthesis
MVVTESLAHGIPGVVRAGTGAVEALGFAAPDEGKSVPGTAVHFPATEDPENPAVLAEALRNWLQDRRIRDTWRAAALETRTTLPGWDRTATHVVDLVANSRTAPDKRQPEG